MTNQPLKQRPSFSPMQAAIFDLDGTLLDSLDVWQQMDITFLGKRGITLPPNYTEAISHLSLWEAAQYTIARFDLREDPASLMAEWKNMALHAYSHTIEMKPYAKEYLHKLKAAGIKLAVATSLPAVLYTPALGRHNIEHLFDALCSVEDVSHSKDHPDIYLLAAQRLGFLPGQPDIPNVPDIPDMSRLYVFEDILTAIKTVKKTGMTVFGIYDKASEQHWDSIQEIADGVIYDYREAP